jgi:hypothetical protein
MKFRRSFLRIALMSIVAIFLVQTYASASDVQAKKNKQPVTQQHIGMSHGAAATSVAASKKDTLIVLARLIEIPGKFPPNDLYNYVYIMKYRVLKVVKGSYRAQEILVGHYNPRISRKQIHDKMASNVKGNLTAFEINAKHRLVLIHPIESVWKDAVEDEYTDSDMEKYFAVVVDKAP